VRGRGQRTDLVHNVNEVERPWGNSRARALRKLRTDAPEALRMFREATKTGQGKRTDLNLPDNRREVKQGHGTTRSYTLDRLHQIVNTLTLCPPPGAPSTKKEPLTGASHHRSGAITGQRASTTG